MPAAYERMRDAFIRNGMSAKAAKGKAARLFNARRSKGTRPVTRDEHGRSPSRGR
jgi:hypothetical protein